MGTKRGKSSEIVLELYKAMRDYRLKDVIALVDPEVTCRPLVRPGLTGREYHGLDGIACLVHDMHAIHGDYQFGIDQITEDGPDITVLARILEPGGEHAPLFITSIFTVKNGVITAIRSSPTPGKP